MQQNPKKNKKSLVPPKHIKVNIYWTRDDEDNIILDEDEIFNDYSTQLAQIMEKYTEPNEIDFEDEVPEGGEC